MVVTTATILYILCVWYIYVVYMIYVYNWRASVASETLTGVTQSKIGDVCLFIYLFIYIDVRMSFCTLTLALVMWSTPSQIALNRILWFIDQYPYHPRNWIVYRLNFFAGAVFLFELVAVVSQCALCMVISRAQQYLLENTLSTRLPRR